MVNVVKLALQRDNAKRFLLRLSNPSQPSSSFSSSKKKKKLRKNSSTRATSSITTNYSNGVSDPPAAPVRGNEEMRVNYEEPIGHAEVLRERMLIQDSLCSRRSSVASVASVQSRASTEVPLPTLANEKIIASGSGITVSLAQAEPVLFLEGADSQDNPKAAMLRGHMRIKVTKAAKIKKVYLSFKGQLNSSWPEGEILKQN